MRRPGILFALLLLAACAAPAVISDIGDASLKVQANRWTPETEIARTAAEGCALYEKEPVVISHVCRDEYCFSREILFACKAPKAAKTANATSPSDTGTSVAGFDGQWAGEGDNDGCGLPWAMQIDVRLGEASGLLWRGKLTYDFHGTVAEDGRLANLLAGKTAASNGIVGPRFITVNLEFAEAQARGTYSMAAPSVGECTVPIVLARHQA